MPKTINKVTILGNAGIDPEVLFGGDKVRLRVATTTARKREDGTYEESTVWHTVVAYGRTGEIVREYVRKGDRIYVEGPIHYREYERDGQRQMAVEIIARDVVLLGGRREEAPTRAPEPVTDDLPF